MPVGPGYLEDSSAESDNPRTSLMDPFSSFIWRLRPTMPFLVTWFVAGLAIALWSPKSQVIIVVALGISMGMLLLGPYAAAAVYSLGLQRWWGGHLRLPLCVVLAVSAVLLLDFLLAWSFGEFILAGITAVVGTVLGHDAALAVLELRHSSSAHLDVWMVVLFPVLIGLSSLAGYCSLGFGMGSYQFILALVG